MLQRLIYNPAIRYFITIVGFSWLFVNLAFAQSYHFEDFGEQQGLPQPYVYSITQDSKGQLWIGTGNGLVKYDGYNFTTFTIEDSIADNFITCSLKTKDGIWFGHMSGDLTYYSNNKFSRKIIEGNEKTMITDIEPDPNNIIWASSYSNGFLLINKKMEVDSVLIGDDQSKLINTFKILNKKEILVGSMDGLSVWDYQKSAIKVTLKEKIANIPETKISDIFEIERDKKYIVATQDKGLYWLERTNFGFETKIVNKKLAQVIIGVQNIIVDKASDIWVGTFGNGLFKLGLDSEGNYSDVINFNIDRGYSSNYVKTIFEDREGNIWSGNYGSGLSRIVKKSYSYSSFHDLADNNVLSVDVDKSYQWLGTSNGIAKINRSNGNIENFYGEKHGIPQGKITSILRTDSLIWVGTEKSGLYYLNPETENVHSYPIHEGNLENSITSIDGYKSQLWVGTRKGLCNINLSNKNKNWYTIRQGGLPNNSINQVLLDSKGKTWVTTNGNTISIIENGIVNKISIPLTNGNFNLNSIAEDNNNNIWVGTLGNGLFLVRNDTLTNISADEGLFSNYCYSLISDTEESLWVGHRGGISRVNVNKFYVKTFTDNYEVAKNYTFNTNAIDLDNDGTVWMGFNKGLLAINNFRDDAVQIPPIISIKSLRVNDEWVEAKDKIVLVPGRYKINIEYIGISLKEPELTKYQYILEGYDDIPVITEGTSVTYPRLSAGQYTFKVSAVNGDGISTQSPVKLGIYIKTSIWKMPWFYGLLIVLISLTVIVLINRQKKKILSENIKLEAKIQERTVEIVKQKEELKKQHDIVNQKNHDITASIRYASRIQQAIIPMENLMNEILPDNFVIYYPRDIVSGDFYWISEVGNKVIFAVADCTGHGVPGAFMSVLGIALLNDLVNNRKINSPEMILTKMRNEIINSLRQDSETSSALDSIDIGICALDKNKQKLQYSGALQPLIHIQDGELFLIKPDRETIGISEIRNKTFTLHELRLKKGDLLYMYSDGFVDQFGGPKNKKFTLKRLRAELLKNCSKSIQEQKQEMENVFNTWKGDYEQTDDVSLIGIQV